MHPHDETMRQAYIAAAQVLASAAVRQLLALEADDPDVGAVMVECTDDGAVSVTLLSRAHQPLGGYSL